jgi:hypothetical protein
LWGTGQLRAGRSNFRDVWVRHIVSGNQVRPTVAQVRRLFVDMLECYPLSLVHFSRSNKKRRNELWDSYKAVVKQFGKKAEHRGKYLKVLWRAYCRGRRTYTKRKLAKGLGGQKRDMSKKSRVKMMEVVRQMWEDGEKKRVCLAAIRNLCRKKRFVYRSDEWIYLYDSFSRIQMNGKSISVASVNVGGVQNIVPVLMARDDRPDVFFMQESRKGGSAKCLGLPTGSKCEWQQRDGKGGGVGVIVGPQFSIQKHTALSHKAKGKGEVEWMCVAISRRRNVLFYGVNVYMPPKAKTSEWKKLDKGLQMISCGIKKPIVLCGDFNVEMNGKRGRTIRQNINNIFQTDGRAMEWENKDSKFTHRPYNGGRQKSIDWMGSCGQVETRQFGVRWECDLDHAVLSVKCEFSVPREKTPERGCLIRWKRLQGCAGAKKRLEFTTLLKEYAKKDDVDFQEWEQAEDVFLTCAEKVLGKSKNVRDGKGNEVPYWDEELEEKRGCVKRECRKLQKLRKREATRVEIQAQGNVVLEKKRDFSYTMRQKKRTFYVELNKGLDELPMGEGMHQMCEKFVRVLRVSGSDFPWSGDEFVCAWEKVMGADPPESFDKDGARLQEVERRLAELECKQEVSWSAKDMGRIAKRLANYKAAGPDGVTGESLKCIPEEFWGKILVPLQKIIKSGKIPAIWKKANVVMIQKVEEAPGVLDYRPISLLSVWSKLVEHMINVKITVECDNIQGGFTEGRGCQENVWMLAILNQMYQKLGVPLYTVSLDLRKAFDSAPHTAIMEALLDEPGVHIHPTLLRYIHHSIRGQTRYLLVPGVTRGIAVRRGVPQGAVLSPTFFKIFINPLLRRLRRVCMKRMVALPSGECIPAVSYADDVTALSHNRQDCQLQMDECEKWALDNGMQWGPKKSRATTLGKVANKDREYEVRMYGEPIEWVREVKVLGVTFKSRQMNPRVQRGVKKVKKKLSMFQWMLAPRNGLPRSLCATLVGASLPYSLLYGTAVHPLVKGKVDHYPGMGAKIILGAYKSDSNSDAVRFLGWRTMEERQALRVVRLCAALARSVHSIFKENITAVLDGKFGKELEWVDYLKHSMEVLGIDTEIGVGERRSEAWIGKCCEHLRGRKKLEAEEMVDYELDRNGLIKPRTHWSLRYCPFDANFVWSATRSSFNPQTEVRDHGEKECWMCDSGHLDTPRDVVEMCTNGEAREIVEEVKSTVGSYECLYDEKWRLDEDVSETERERQYRVIGAASRKLWYLRTAYRRNKLQQMADDEP